LITWLSAFTLYDHALPKYEQVRLIKPDSTSVDLPYPYKQPKLSKGYCVWEFTWQLNHLFPKKYGISSTDRIEAVTVNGHHIEQVTGTSLEFVVADFGEFLQPGPNKIRITLIHDEGTRNPRLYPVLANWAILMPSILFIVSAGITLCWATFLFPRLLTKAEATILLGGVALLILYFMAFPYYYRAYDWWGHFFYIRYVYDTLSLPSTYLSWETYHPPLFYCLAAVIGKIVALLGGGLRLVYASWFSLPFAISICILFCSVWLSRLLFTARENSQRLWFLACMAFAPKLIFPCTNFNNDALLNLILFILIGVLIVFWQQPNGKNWGLISGLLGLGLITKTNSVVFVPLAFFLLAITNKLSLKIKLRFAAIGAAIVLLLAGWFHIPRWFEAPNSPEFMVGNLYTLDEPLKIPQSLKNLFVFNPCQVVQIPYNETRGDGFRREYYPEFVFKSALGMEWGNHSSVTLIRKVILVCAMLLLPIVALGYWKELFKIKAPTWPLTLIIPLAILTQMILVWRAPFSCCQDARYILYAIIPWCYFLLKGMDYSPPWLGQAAKALLVFLFINFALMIALLGLYPV
jgi:hypothetical protein